MTQARDIPLPVRPAAPGAMPTPPAAPAAAVIAGPAGSAGAALGHPGRREAVRSLYVHVPFCAHKCHYCDFYSFVDTRDQQEAFTTRLQAELRALAPHARDAHGRPVPLQTIFIGGGTPSLLRPELWTRLLETLAESFDLSAIFAARDRHAPARAGGGDQIDADAADASTDAEFTVECNPESASGELLARLRAGGVTRVSLGAQSFDARHLRTLERGHQVDNVALALSRARDAGITRRSIDLIYAVPGQTLDDFSRDLDAALALGLNHLSCYNLTYEPNTAMTVRLRRGEFEPVDEDTESAMFALAAARLGAAGLERYEVSNYAAPGQACRHNLAYWRQAQWLAAGPSASGHVWAAPGETDPATLDPARPWLGGGHRWKNVPRLDDYLASGDGFSPMVDHEPPDPARALRERIMTGLRLGEGLDATTLLADVRAVRPASEGPLSRRVGLMVRDGHVTDRDGRWRLTDAGTLLADHLAAELMATLR